MEEIRQGEYRIIRTDGTEILIEEKPNMDRILKAIGAECADTVSSTNKRARRSWSWTIRAWWTASRLIPRRQNCTTQSASREPCTRFPTATWPFTGFAETQGKNSRNSVAPTRGT